MTIPLVPKEAFILPPPKELFPYVPIHPSVIDYLKKVKALEEIPSIKESFFNFTSNDLTYRFGEERKTELMGLIKDRLDPKDKPYLLRGIFNGNCDSIEQVYDMNWNKFNFKPWKKTLGDKNVTRLNNLLPHYTSSDQKLLVVTTHNPSSSEIDPILHLNWAIAVNNETLKYLK